jgi:two-component system, OmpR family, sensor histidine kinase KdpD
MSDVKPRARLRPSMTTRSPRPHTLARHARGPEPGRPTERVRPPEHRLSRRRLLIGWGIALVGVVLLTAVLDAVRDDMSLASILLLYLSVCVTASATGGWAPGLAAVIGSIALADYFFTEPYFQWTVDDPQVVVALVVFGAVTATVAVLTDVVATRTRQALRAQAEATGLAQLTSALVDSDDPLGQLTYDLCSCFDLEGVSLLRPTENGWETVADAGAHPPRSPLSGDDAVAIPRSEVQLVMNGPRLPQEDRRLLAGFAGHIALVLAREQRS